jgi:hypothetical protein
MWKMFDRGLDFRFSKSADADYDAHDVSYWGK